MIPFANALRMGVGLRVQDVFDTDLWTGTGAAQSITTPFAPDFAWIKSRSTASSHALFDTTQGAGVYLTSNLNSANTTAATTLSTFDATGYTLGTDAAALVNTSARTYVGWALKKAAKFFDVVSWTGNSTNRTIAHNLAVAPGMIVVKKTNAGADWQVYHRSLANTDYLVLNTTAATVTDATRWNSMTATSAVFSLGTDTTVNNSGDTYVAYVFAHDTASDGIVQCGTYTSPAEGTLSINLGWEPQFLLVKTTTADEWWMFDTARGFSAASLKGLRPRLSNEETTFGPGSFVPTATGFDVTSGFFGNYPVVYMAIRKP